MSTAETTTQTANGIAKSKGNTMTKNRNYLKYNSFLEKSAELKLRLQALHSEQKELLAAESELTMGKINSLQEIGQSVFRKCFPNSYEVPTAMAKEILGELFWIYARLQLKELRGDSIALSQVRHVHSSTIRGGSIEEESSLSVDRNVLHISDRDFAKLVRAKANKWKADRRLELEELRDKELKSAQLAARAADKKLRDLEAKRAAAESKLAAKEARAAARLAARRELASV